MASALRVVLASASPRRSELLHQIGVEHVIDRADINESVRTGESPEYYVARMAREKARVVAARYLQNGAASRHAVLAADTTVVLGNEILGKPRDRSDALQVLARLSGREHTVLSAIHLICGEQETFGVVTTAVQFDTLTRQTCERYVATDEPWDKAGSYAIQGLAGVFVRSIQGSYSNVVGLPLAETWELLRAAGVVALLNADPACDSVNH